MKKKIRVRDIIILQLVIILYTGSSIMAKFAAAQELFSLPFLLFYGGEIMILGVYAICWQQIIKRFELSIAYANRAMVLVWSLLWAVVIFHDRVTFRNLAGIALVIAGTVIVNTAGEEAEQ
ncbi:MAG: transporter [Lachnospiraceae bacterium]|nr:transporter [Lachnospiraceae bacterium]